MAASNALETYFTLSEGRETAFSVEPASLKFGPGVLAEVGADARALGLGRVGHITDARVRALERSRWCGTACVVLASTWWFTTRRTSSPVTARSSRRRPSPFDTWSRTDATPPSPRRALRELEKALAADAMVSTDIGKETEAPAAQIRGLQCRVTGAFRFQPQFQSVRQTAYPGCGCAKPDRRR